MNTPRAFFRKNLPHYLMVLPFFALFAIFFLYPIAYGIWISLTKWNGVKPPVFVGLKNYINIFTNPMVLFWTALGNLGKFIIIVVPVGVIIALGLAILVNPH